MDRVEGIKIRKQAASYEPRATSEPYAVLLEARSPKLAANSSFFEISPPPPIAFHQFVGLFRAPGSRLIVGEITRWQRHPHIENGIDDAPTRLEHVCSPK